MDVQEFVIEGIGREWPELSDLLLKVFMDGKAIHTVGLWKQEVLAGFCIRGALVGSVAMQPFAFQAIEYTGAHPQYLRLYVHRSD